MCSVPSSGETERVGRHGAVHPVPFSPYVPNLDPPSSRPSPRSLYQPVAAQKYLYFWPKNPKSSRPSPIVGFGEPKALPAPNCRRKDKLWYD